MKNRIAQRKKTANGDISNETLLQLQTKNPLLLTQRIYVKEKKQIQKDEYLTLQIGFKSLTYIFKETNV